MAISVGGNPPPATAHWWEKLHHVGTWLALLALGVPVLGGLWIAIYAFTTPGSHGSYLGVGMAEVSDWLTKLLLGAGLVQLTHLATPISHLIDNIAAGLTPTTSTGTNSAAKVMAGSILFGYVVIGILDAYVVTTMWYQNKLEEVKSRIGT